MFSILVFHQCKIVLVPGYQKRCILVTSTKNQTIERAILLELELKNINEEIAYNFTLFSL